MEQSVASTRASSTLATSYQLNVIICPQENWSAFAPDFKELDENVEYEERESEFDIEDEDKSEPEQTGGVWKVLLEQLSIGIGCVSCVAPAGADAAEDEEVDVTTVDPIVAFCSRLEQY